jgi:hypothetical protein
MPSPVGAARIAEPMPCAPTPNLVPGPITPELAPSGPPDCLSLPADHTSAFQCENYPPECAAYFHIGSLAYQRQKPGKGATAVVDPFDPASGISVMAMQPIAQRYDDIVPELAWGEKLTIGYLWENQAIEWTGFTIFQHHKFSDKIIPGRIDSSYFNAPPGFGPGFSPANANNSLAVNGDRVETRLASTMYSSELTYRCTDKAVTDLEFLCGFRYFDLREDLATFTDGNTLVYPNNTGSINPALQATHSVTTFNRLIGPQFGVEYTYPWTCWFATGATAKGCWGANFVDTRLRLQRGDGLIGFNLDRSQVIFSHLYEVGVNVEFKLLERAKIRAGYNAMWFLNMMNVVDQVDFNLGNPRGRNNRDGSIFYHGPSIELQLLF